MATSEPRAFATCPKGLEGLLRAELLTLGALATKETIAGVRFDASMRSLYRVCLWSRLANRVLLPIAELDVRDADDLYAGVRTIEWQDHLRVDGSFVVDFAGHTATIKHTHYGALKCKDAIVDHFRDRLGHRPSIDKHRPDVRVNAYLHDERLTISIDLSGESLHRRGYRKGGGPAPLKENLASALLMRAGWPEIAETEGALIDPLCGSGTFLIEGAGIAMGIAPSLGRDHFGFSGWLGHVPSLWQEELGEASERRERARTDRWPLLIGYDANAKVLALAEQNIAAAGLEGCIGLRLKGLAQLTRPTHVPLIHGLLITNPPYGERLGEEGDLAPLYRCLGDKLKQEFCGWRAGVITGNPALGKHMGLRAHRQYQFWNGAIKSKLLLFDIRPEHFVGGRPGDGPAGAVPPRLSEGAQMFANRLRKNRKQLARWRKENAITCYRLYDADMPEYAVAVDVYEDWVHVAEYQAPTKVDAASAERRLRDVLAAIPEVMRLPLARLVLKQRERQRGARQYERKSARGELIEVHEAEARLLVNLHDYIDTGLFLDHRLLRRHLAGLAKGKRFLNLFCYTAAATVHAALGGARLSTSVDMSAPHLGWARRNLALNGISEHRHELVQADCLEWLQENREGCYDVILLDPPTFSNSKRMRGTLDIQRDHIELIRLGMRRLDREGVLIFSTNRREFELAAEQLTDLEVEDATRWTIDKDFQRARLPHRGWFIRHRTLCSKHHRG